MAERDDILSAILDSIHLRTVSAHRNTYSAPQVLDCEPEAATFYLVLQGSCGVRMDGHARPHSLRCGDLALVPLKTRHALSIEPEHRDGRVTEGILLCGTFVWEEGENDPISSMLPEVILCPSEDGVLSDWLKLTLSLIDQEVTELRQGMHAIVSHLTQIVFAHAIRSCLPSGTRPGCKLRNTINDRQIGPAVASIHTRPEQPWSVSSLARTSAMSRSSFAAKFAHLTGLPPMRYVLEQRMRKACALLRETKLSVKAISGQAGYGSEAAFSHAFKKWAGVSALAYRASGCPGQGRGRPE